jgi:hypothetical protein
MATIATTGANSRMTRRRTRVASRNHDQHRQSGRGEEQELGRVDRMDAENGDHEVGTARREIVAGTGDPGEPSGRRRGEQHGRAGREYGRRCPPRKRVWPATSAVHAAQDGGQRDDGGEDQLRPCGDGDSTAEADMATPIISAS